MVGKVPKSGVQHFDSTEKTRKERKNDPRSEIKFFLFIAIKIQIFIYNCLSWRKVTQFSFFG